MKLSRMVAAVCFLVAAACGPIDEETQQPEQNDVSAMKALPPTEGGYCGPDLYCNTGSWCCTYSGAGGFTTYECVPDGQICIGASGGGLGVQ